jgi:hypothetical protein
MQDNPDQCKRVAIVAAIFEPSDRIENTERGEVMG